MSVFQVVKRSAQLFWRNKFLWWLGILPGFLVGVVGAFSNVLGVDGEEILWMHRDWASLAVFVQEKVNFNIWIVLGIFLLFITAGVFSALMTLSTYRAAAQLYQGHERESIWRLLSRSRKQFWSWLGLPLVAGLMLSVSLLPVGGLLVLGGAIMTQTSVNPVLIFWLVFALVCLFC